MSTLTPEQQAVVNHRDGHAKVIAVAGAGKTTTLTHFIAARLREGVDPRRMLVVMYNKAAQVDFSSKLERLLPQQARPEIRTFHSLGLRIYQRLIQQGYLPAFAGKPLSDGEMDGVVWRLLQQHAPDAGTAQDILSQRKKWVEPAMAFIDLVKSSLRSPSDILHEQRLPPQCAFFLPVFHAFEQWRKQQQRISYADMLYEPVHCLQQHPELAQQFGGHMHWLLVDEYQDINDIQHALLTLLHGGRGNMLVIGDPDQTIYEFRGSRPEFIVSQFDQQWPNVHRYELPHTFRYGHALSLLANHLIHHNQQRDPVLCLSHPRTPQTQIEQHHSPDEAHTVLHLIQQHAEQHPLEDIAVINRLWALCAPIELGLLQANIPYQLHNSISVLDRWELHLFWILLEIGAGQFQQRSQSQREHAWLHLLTTPYPKIKRPILEQLARTLANSQDHYSDALMHAIPDELGKWQAQQIEARAQLLEWAEHKTQPAYNLLQEYVDQTDLYAGIEDSAFSAQQIEDRLQTIRAFLRFMKESGKNSRDALDYLNQLKTQRVQQRHEKPHGVHLTSIHKSKGLEWPVVIIPGLNGHYFPYTADGEFSTPASEESERRLLYVAMTRAQQQLHLIVPPQQPPKPQKTRNQQTRNLQGRELISPFQPELRFQHSQRIGQALYQQQPSVQLNPQHGSLAPWLEHYPQRLGLTLDLGIETTPVRSHAPLPPRNTIIRSKFNSDTAQPARLTRLRHSHLGEGTVIQQDEHYLRVLFDGETQSRQLDQRVAGRFIEWL